MGMQTLKERIIGFECDGVHRGAEGLAERREVEGLPAGWTCISLKCSEYYAKSFAGELKDLFRQNPDSAPGFSIPQVSGSLYGCSRICLAIALCKCFHLENAAQILIQARDANPDYTQDPEEENG